LFFLWCVGKISKDADPELPKTSWEIKGCFKITFLNPSGHWLGPCVSECEKAFERKEEDSGHLPLAIYRDESHIPSDNEKYLNSFQKRNVFWCQWKLIH
jgi:hypothetical protein